MEYNKIIAVTGLPGLYELLSSKSDGAIVRSLDDKTTRFVSSRIHNFSHLESIEVYTVRDNANLVDILKAMEVSAEKLPDEKDGAELKAYFTKVYPDLDFDRVYSSDLKKMVKWFSVLKANNIEIKLSEPEEEEEAAPEEAVVEEATAVSKKTAAPKKGATTAEATATAKAPAKAAATAEKPATAEKAVKAEKAVAKEKAAPAEAEKPKAKKTDEKEKDKPAKTEKAKKTEGDKTEKPVAEKQKGTAKKKS